MTIEVMTLFRGLTVNEVVNSKGEPNFGNFPNSRCGPISTRVGAYENQYLKLFRVGGYFFVGLVSGFLFSVQKTETFLISNRRKETPTQERTQKTSGVTLATFFRTTLTLVLYRAEFF